jgi:asparagine synthase (glutamine-hydrolysing)
MSAIYGIINKDCRPVDPEQVQKMKWAMRHRAHDGSSEMIFDNAAFGFCKLSLYPNQEDEQLPIRDGDLLFTSNARLHNRDELIKRLGLSRKQHENVPDSVLILTAFKMWGDNCVDYLDGEYVFVIWNQIDNTLFVGHDHIGFKGFYYFDSSSQFIFCSEIKGIESIKTDQNRFDEQELLRYFFNQADAKSTYNKEIKRLTGGTTLTLQRNTLILRKYWMPKPSGKYIFKKENDWYDCMLALVTDAVHNRLGSNENIGISLSGGLDSAGIAGILAESLKKKNKQLYGFSSVLPENYTGTAWDEKYFLNLLGKRHDNIIQTNIYTSEIRPFDNFNNAFFSDESIPNVAYSMDQAILRKAKEHNIKILFSGFGGDQWASVRGDSVIYNLFRRFRPVQALKLLKSFSTYSNLPLHVEFRRHVLKQTFLNKFYAYTNKHFSLADFFNVKMIQRSKLTNAPEIFNDVAFYFRNSIFAQEVGRVLDNRHEIQGISSAFPLFDRNLIEFLVEVPHTLYVKSGCVRSLFRNTMKDVLPNEITWRKSKSYFVPGLKELIVGEEREFATMFETKGETVSCYFNWSELQYLLQKAVYERHGRFSQSIYPLTAAQFLIALKALQNLRDNGYICNI